MTYDPHKKTLHEVREYFTHNAARFPGMSERLEEFLAAPSLTTARAFMGTYFRLHKKDDIESLRMATATFADKRLVKEIVNSIINDEDALREIAHRSYPHPIGFDKLVLYDDRETGFKFRLHIYWRGNQRAAMERMHLHRFEMASAIVTGELANHTWRVRNYRPESDLLPAMELTGDTSGVFQTRHAYSGYWRDPQGVLHKRYLGQCDMTRGDSSTFVSGRTYAQVLSDAHYVETNAETGASNGDICSTVYVHSGGLRDNGGRGMPILFEDACLADSDQIIESIPELSPEALKKSLEHYRDFIQQHLDFYDWLYDPKHGRNLSVGMVAGYLLSESQHSPHTISLWLNHEKEYTGILEDCSATLASLVRGEMKISDLSDDDRNKRYYALLLDKAENYPGGREEWLQLNGNLVKEMWRYCAALKGERPEVTVLKPMWESVVGKKMPGGAHYGHIAAMIEAAFDANAIALKHFKGGEQTIYKADDSPACDTEQEIAAAIRKKLNEHFPSYPVTGEEEGDGSGAPPKEGDRRWRVDSIDATRNFLSGRDDFCVSIACQRFTNGAWETTDAAVSIPVSGKIFWAEKGAGAWLIERNDLEYRLHVPNPAVKTVLKNTLIDISLSGFGPEGEGEIITGLRREGAVYRGLGSAAIMLSMVAGKGSDGVIMTAHDYDIAAAKLIAEEAGATITHLDFPRDGYDFTATVAGANPEIHQRLQALTQHVISRIAPVPSPHSDPSPR